MNIDLAKIKLEPIKVDEDKSSPIFANEDCQNALKMWEEYYPKMGYHLPWVGYFVIYENEVIGCCAFTGPPKNNTVEVSYWTFSSFEGNSVSTTSCKLLIALAKKEEPNLTIIAKTAPENNASTKILKRCGFIFDEIVQDHEIGDAWKWVLEESKT